LRGWFAVAICSGYRSFELSQLKVGDVWNEETSSVYLTCTVKYVKGGLIKYQEELLGDMAPHIRERRVEEAAERIERNGRPANRERLASAAMIDYDAFRREAFKQGMTVPISHGGGFGGTGTGHGDGAPFRVPWEDIEVYAILAGHLDGRNRHDWRGILDSYKLYFLPKRTNVDIKDKWKTNKYEYMSDHQLREERDRLQALPSVREKVAAIVTFQGEQRTKSRAAFLESGSSPEFRGSGGGGGSGGASSSSSSSGAGGDARSSSSARAPKRDRECRKGCLRGQCFCLD
jgi:hypothetical protein